MPIRSRLVRPSRSGSNNLEDFRDVRDNIAGGRRVTTGRQVPFCLFTDPELARVGLSESDAKSGGIADLARSTMAEGLVPLFSALPTQR
jgi:pyruvate/2-oxoglutarate dehydrogenase complex dihydrolipoamide dehydrogenase (E3) component